MKELYEIAIPNHFSNLNNKNGEDNIEWGLYIFYFEF